MRARRHGLGALPQRNAQRRNGGHRDDTRKIPGPPAAGGRLLDHSVRQTRRCIDRGARRRNGLGTPYRIGNQLHRRDEPVTTLGQRLDETRVFRGIAEGLAELVHRFVEAVIEIDPGVRRPEPLPQLLAQHDLTVSLEKHLQDSEGLVLESDLHATLAHLARAQVYVKHAEPNGMRRAFFGRSLVHSVGSLALASQASVSPRSSGDLHSQFIDWPTVIRGGSIHSRRSLRPLAWQRRPRILCRRRTGRRARKRLEPKMDQFTACMASVADGDTDALAALYDRTSRMVYGAAVRILRRRDEAEEVVLDVYTQVWRNATGFDPGRGSIEAWLLMITRTRAIDRLRARTARPDVDGAAVEALEHRRTPVGADQMASAWDAHRTIGGVLPRLAPRERQLIEMAFLEGYTHRELAALLGLPIGTVKTRIRNSLRIMRGALERSPACLGGRRRSEGCA